MIDDLRHPARFTRGPEVRLAAVSYLALVLVSVGYAVFDALFVDSIGASFALLPAIVLTAPLSMTVGVVPFGVPSVVPGFGYLLMTVFGAVLALGFWRIFRGRRVTGPSAVQAAVGG